eukprot:Opistho-2@38818
MAKTADLCDEFETKIAVVNAAPHMLDYGGRTDFEGIIATVQCPDDNTHVRKQLECNGEGKVLVVDGGGATTHALVGDMLAELAANNGWSGIVVNGCIRDSAAVQLCPIGVKAIGTHPKKTAKRNLGQSNLTVSFGGVEFVPGHYLYADADGIIVSPSPLK